MLDGILRQRLYDHGRDPNLTRGGVNIERDPQSFSKASLLDIEVSAHEVDFVRHSYPLPLCVAHRVAKDFRELLNRLLGLSRLAWYE